MVTSKGGRPNIDRLKRKRLVGGLVDALRHDDVVVQLEAARALAELAQAGHIKWEPRDAHEHALMVLSAPGTFEARKDNLAALDEAAVPTLVACLEGLSARSGVSVAPWMSHNLTEVIRDALGAIGGDEGVDRLVAMVVSDKARVADDWGTPYILAGYAAKALGMIGDPRAVEPLLGLAHDSRHAVTCVQALVNIVRRSAPQMSTETLRSLAAMDRIRGPFDEAVDMLRSSEWPESREEFQAEVGFVHGTRKTFDETKELAEKELASRES